MSRGFGGEYLQAVESMAKKKFYFAVTVVSRAGGSGFDAAI
jgi:hypothetical protein